MEVVETTSQGLAPPPFFLVVVWSSPTAGLRVAELLPWPMEVVQGAEKKKKKKKM
jgi:hypothetical protein